ncbi:MAG: outer membrane protein assembly factor [Bacteroidia bacterium]|nr:outer membrane protein assembly factor [Bacteroidia bacterium]
MQKNYLLRGGKLICLCVIALISDLGFPQLAAQDSIAQKPTTGLMRLAEQLFGETAEPGKPKFLIYPTIAYAPETSLEIGFSGLYLFHARNNYEINRLSEIQAFAFFTLRRQMGIWLDHAIYGHEDAWISLGRNRLQRFPLLYYGIGPETPPDGPAVVNADYLLIREDLLKQILPNLFLGFSVDYQRLFNAEIELDPDNPLPLPLGAGGNRNLGLGGSLVFDSRTNVLNERDAWFSELSLLSYQPAWGSDFRLQRMVVDSRVYLPVSTNRSQVLAAQVYGNFIAGDSIPFNMLALLGNESLLRGYYTGRFRDRNYLATQVEYRFLPFPFSKRLGGAAFVGVGAVAPRLADLRLDQLKPSGGVGLRFLLFPEKDIFVRFDVAFTPEGPNFYFYTGEAF